MEAGLEFATVVGLGALHLEGQPVEDQIYELDGCLLIESLVDPEHAEASAVVNRGLLVEALAAGDGRDELDIDLQAVAWLWLLVMLPAFLMGLVALALG